jgi:hypothetical protein
MSLDMSLNEVEMLATRATRGAGHDWGRADETGRAARWLARSGFGWDRILRDLLERTGTDQPAHEIGSTRLVPAVAGSMISPIVAGCWLLDRTRRAAGPLQLYDVVQPVMIAPFAARAAGLSQRNATLLCGEISLPLAATGDVASIEMFEMLDACDAATLTFAWSDHTFRPARRRRRRSSAAPDHWNVLTALAARTYVAASEASRMAGAGGGSTDLD